jgi:hypothetical protein
MAKADQEHIEEVWTINDAFRYLTEKVGLRDYDAIHQLTERIRSGRLPVHVNGHSSPPTLWLMGQLALTIDAKGCAQVTPTTVGMKPWPCAFTVDAREVRRLWRPKPPKAKAASASYVRDRVLQLFNGPLKERIKPGMLAHEAEKLVQPLYSARYKKKVSRDTIGRALEDWQGAK